MVLELVKLEVKALDLVGDCSESVGALIHGRLMLPVLIGGGGNNHILMGLFSSLGFHGF